MYTSLPRACSSLRPKGVWTRGIIQSRCRRESSLRVEQLAALCFGRRVAVGEGLELGSELCDLGTQSGVVRAEGVELRALAVDGFFAALARLVRGDAVLEALALALLLGSELRRQQAKESAGVVDVGVVVSGRSVVGRELVVRERVELLALALGSTLAERPLRRGRLGRITPVLNRRRKLRRRRGRRGVLGHRERRLSGGEAAAGKLGVRLEREMNSHVAREKRIDGRGKSRVRCNPRVGSLGEQR
eukprot:Amastigsp_a174684_2505.p2 type:complete len:246 gc:universal Amastigsp_a174684_2505:3-740(+)